MLGVLTTYWVMMLASQKLHVKCLAVVQKNTSNNNNSAVSVTVGWV